VTGSSQACGIQFAGATFGSPCTVPNRVSAGASSKDSDISSSNASGRLTVAAGSAAIAGITRNCGGVVGSGASGGVTWNCMTWPVVDGSATGKSTPGMPPPNGSSGPTLPSVQLPTGTFVKSTMTSARSAGPISRRLPLTAVWLTGAARNPPSLPICQTSTPGIWLKSTIRKRDWQPFSRRNR